MNTTTYSPSWGRTIAVAKAHGLSLRALYDRPPHWKQVRRWQHPEHDTPEARQFREMLRAAEAIWGLPPKDRDARLDRAFGAWLREVAR